MRPQDYGEWTFIRPGKQTKYHFFVKGHLTKEEVLDQLAREDVIKGIGNSKRPRYLHLVNGGKIGQGAIPDVLTKIKKRNNDIT